MSVTAANVVERQDGRRLFGWRSGVMLSVMAAAIVGMSHGFSAAAGEVAPSAASVDAPTITLAGRWTGPRYGFKMRPSSSQECANKQCHLTYDIVACGDAWCGIAVTEATPCGAIGLRMAADTSHNRKNAFAGKLELAKGSQPYTVEAWYAQPGDRAGEGSDKPRLSFVGDTGSELLMMRRSFPFQAELTRVSDALCTLEKATS